MLEVKHRSLVHGHVNHVIARSCMYFSFFMSSLNNRLTYTVIVHENTYRLIREKKKNEQDKYN